MGFSTHLGPQRLGTVKEGSGRNCGVTIVSQSNTVAYTDSTAKNLFILPAGAQVLNIIIDVVTAFTDTGTDTISIGKTGSAAYFVNAADVSAQIHTNATLVAANLSGIVNVGTSDVQVIGTFAGQNGNAGAGLAYVTCVYAVKSSDGLENPVSV